METKSIASNARACVQCGKTYIPHHSARFSQKYCSKDCGKRAWYPERKPLLEQQCSMCGEKFTTRLKLQKYCGLECSKESNSYISIATGLPTGTVGAISDLIVCADLLKKGYEVFRSVSQSCSCDLAILKNGHLLRVEVKTGYSTARGKRFTNKPSHPEKFDILAVAYHDGVKYEPDLP